MDDAEGIVGRDREVSLLLRALSASTRLILIEGEAGVGKTRLVEEAMRQVTATGSIVLKGDCLPVGEPLPMLPVVAALGELARRDDGALIASALRAAPEFVRGEVGRLLPQLGTENGSAQDRQGAEWQRERLFAGLAWLVAGLAQRSPVCFVVEDVHWADSGTLDFLTFLARSAGSARVIVTCRSDESALPAHVTNWLTAMRASADADQISVAPLPRADVGRLAAAQTGGQLQSHQVDELYSRAEGNPFFTEQLLAAMLADPSAGSSLRLPSGLPLRLAGLLTARANRCAGTGRQILTAMSVARRPLSEAQLSLATGLDAREVRQGLLELSAAKLLAGDDAGILHRPRHALLAEAVAGTLLSGERVELHERIAIALGRSADPIALAEVAGHWQAAGRVDEEFSARIVAAESSERVCAYAEAAQHWQRAIVLSQMPPADNVVGAAPTVLPHLYARAIDALSLCGDRLRARDLAEDAFGRFAQDPDPATAAMVLLRISVLRDIDSPSTARPLMDRAIKLFEQCAPSVEKATAWFRYGGSVYHSDGRLEESRRAFSRAATEAAAAGDHAMTARAVSWLAINAFLRGNIDEGHTLLDRSRAAAASHDETKLRVAEYTSTVLFTLGKLQEAVTVGLLGLDAARQAGLGTSLPAGFLTAMTAEALLELGKTGEAASLIDPWTSGQPDRDHFDVHERRAQIDLLRGDTAAAVRRQQQVSALSFAGSIQNSLRVAQDASQLALWVGRPVDALAEVQQLLPRIQSSDLTMLCGRLLNAGLRACADLAEQARSRGDSRALRTALAHADGLGAWIGQMSDVPFTDHAYVVAIPAERAAWKAEQTRLAGSSDPLLWASSAHMWQELGQPHRAGYAWWRHAQAQLDEGQPARQVAPVLSTAYAAADGHAPLLSRVRLLADRARIMLQLDGDADAADATASAALQDPYGLTVRELAVLRLLAVGRTNAQIGAELYISPSTAGVHVSSILRKLGVTGRVQAAATAERAGLLFTP